MYIGDFSNWEDVSAQFGEKIETPSEVFLAFYDNGFAHVFYRRGSKYYWATGQDYSWSGIRECWAPEEYDSLSEFFRAITMWTPNPRYADTCRQERALRSMLIARLVRSGD